MGKLEPRKNEMGHEVGLLFTVTAPTQRVAASIAKTFAHFALHFPIPEWRGLISGLAFPMSRSEEHTSELQSLMRISYAVFCLKKKKQKTQHTVHTIMN